MNVAVKVQDDVSTAPDDDVAAGSTLNLGERFKQTNNHIPIQTSGGMEEADFYTVQVHFNRGWKLLLLGLTQAESFARYIDMCSLHIALPSINDTLLDSTTRESLIRILINLVNSDERFENRLKAVYLLGELGHYLGRAFKQMITKILEIQIYEKERMGMNDSSRFTDENRAFKIHLLHSIGRLSTSLQYQPKHFEDMVIYIIHEEFSQGDNKPKVIRSKADGKRQDSGATFVIRALLGILNNDIKKTEANQNNWFPVVYEDAILLGIENMISGLKSTKDIDVPNFNALLWEQELKVLMKKRLAAESRRALRAKLLRQMLQIPGTYCKLHPVQDYPGFFAEDSATLIHTESIVVSLPVNPLSNIMITCPLPQIPGIPNGATTVPYPFMDQSAQDKLNKPPTHKYEYLERTGRVPGLPFGFTYAPGPFTEVKAPHAEGTDTKGGDNEKKSATLQNSLKILRRVSIVAGTMGALRRSSTVKGRPSISEESRDECHSVESSLRDEGDLERSVVPAVPYLAICRGLKAGGTSSDFLVNGPVIFDIIQPRTQKLQRVFTTVLSINKELSAIHVQNSTSNSNVLEIGATFNIFIRSRADPDKWVSVNLEVIDDDYDDVPVDASNASEVATKAAKVPSDRLFHFPIPSGYSGTNEPYFAPPLNLPPFPIGYTANRIPFYGKTASIKPIPAGMTNFGTRFYIEGRSTPNDSAKNLVAGYDNSGFPIFLPRGCNLPSPSGFTPDGIAFYDIPSMMQQRGIMVLPASLSIQATWPLLGKSAEPESPDADAGQRHDILQKKHQERLRNLVVSLESSMTQVSGHFLRGSQRPVGDLNRVSQFNRVRQQDEDCGTEYLEDPDDIIGFLRESEDTGYLKAHGMKVMIDPDILKFQSVHAPVTNSTVLRYRAGRGDHEERDFFVSVEPVDIFSVKSFHFRLQGEGVLEMAVSFNPKAMKADQVDGSLHLIDDSGRKLAMCRLVALKQSFVRVSPLSIDAGWILPERRKESILKIENVSSGAVSINLRMQSDAATTSGTPQAPSRPQTSRSGPFSVALKTLKLQPYEQKSVPISFESASLGRCSDVLEIHSPGGDMIKVQLVGIAGIPITLYPEDAESSMAGAAALTRERCEFMRKFQRGDSKDKPHLNLSPTDTAILKNMMSATSDQESRREAHTLDFGISPMDSHVQMRCLTLMNLSDVSITVGLYCQHPAIKCPYLVRIAPRMANTVEVVLSMASSLAGRATGNIKTIIEVICPEFQNIPLTVRAFIGQPLYFPSWELAFFKPARIGDTESVTLFLINESQYNISFIARGIEAPPPDSNQNFIISSISTDEASPSLISPVSAIPVTFVFNARQRGPLLQSVRFKLLTPFELESPSAMFGKPLSLVGICVEPYIHRPGELPDKNGIDFLRMWMSHPKRVLDEYPSPEEMAQRFDLQPVLKPLSRGSMVPYTPPAGSNQTTACATYCEAVFIRDNIEFKMGAKLVGQSDNFRRSQLQPVPVKNRSNHELTVSFLASTLFTIDPRSKTMPPHDSGNVDVMFVPPLESPDVLRFYGFGMALLEHDHSFHAIQMIGKSDTDFLIFPPPNKDKQITLDFGRVEVSSLEISQKTLLLCNTFPASYSWSVKMISGKSKFSAFEIGMILGELHAYETYPLVFKFHADSSGTFESMAEVHIAETLDRHAKPTKVATVLLRGQMVNTSLFGCPDVLEFGSTVVFQKKEKKFTITNNGSTETLVTILVKPPFYVGIKSFHLTPKAQQEIAVSYQPTESRSTVIKMLVFSNLRLYIVNLSGTGGTAQLICEKYEDRAIDFGYQREGTVAWLPIYATNKGTLPLSLKAITSDSPDLVKIEFLNITSTVPYEGTTSGAGMMHIRIRKDYWSILRRKFQVFNALKDLLKVAKGAKSRSDYWSDGDRKDDLGISVQIHKTDTIDILGSSIPEITPILRPFYSYHFLIGYCNKYQTKTDTFIDFHYMPVTTEESTNNLPLLLKSMRLHVDGNAYRPLEFFPPFHDFGIVATEAYSGKTAKEPESAPSFPYGVVRQEDESKSHTLMLQIINMSMETQNLSLQYIHPEFSISGRSWHLQPGEKLHIPVDFHPPKEQVQYRGEARFLHKHGVSTIRLAGTGASADLICDRTLDFGSLKIGTTGTRALKLSNRGLMICRFWIYICQSNGDFKLHGSDPSEYEGSVESGCSTTVTVECSTQSPIEKPAHLRIKWLRVPGGIWEQTLVPLFVRIGIPIFKIHKSELDFGTTYINVNKVLSLLVSNDGNAVCMWSSRSESVNIEAFPSTGVINPGETFSIRVKYSPLDYQPLSTSLSFETDAGNKVAMCYGIVGVPYLMISKELMAIDFGIAAINKTHTRSIEMENTGSKPIEFEVSIFENTQDGVPSYDEDYDIFFADPPSGVVQPGEKAKIMFHGIPREYGAINTAKYMIRTRDGEQYTGSICITGGKAIIKLAPPKVTDETTKPTTAEQSRSTPQSRLGSTPTARSTTTFEAGQMAMFSHIENLQEILAGLRAAELDNGLAESKRQGRPDGSRIHQRHGTRVSTFSRESVDSRQPFTPTSAHTSTAASGTPRRRREGSVGSEVGGRGTTDDEALRFIQGTRVFDGSDFKGKATSESGKQVRFGYTPKSDEDGQDGAMFDVPSTASERRADTSSTAASRIETGDRESRGIQSRRSFERRSSRSQKSTAPQALPHELDDESAAVKYMDELTAIEAELEKALLSEIDMAADLQGENGQDRRWIGGLGRYRPAQERRRLPDRSTKPDVASRTPEPDQAGYKGDSKTSGASPTGPSKGKEVNGEGAEAAKGRQLREHGASEGGSEEPHAEAAQRIEHTLGNLINMAQGLMNQSRMILHGYTEKTSEEIGLLKKKIDAINNRVIESTKSIMKNVRDQLSGEWVPNREFLTGTLRRLQASNHVVETLTQLSVSAKKDDDEVDTFNLGLFRIDQRSEDILLFNLPNTGNLSFDFELVPILSQTCVPPGVEGDGFEYFQITPSSGTIDPRNSINISASVFAATPGLYQQGYELRSAGEVVLSFYLSARIGVPRIELAPAILDFGLVTRRKTSTRTLLISNAGTFRDIWRIEPIIADGGSQAMFSGTASGANRLPFECAQQRGELEPGDSVEVGISFSPTNEGPYQQKYRLTWSMAPISFETKGIGGGVRIKPTYVDPADIQFGGLDWGTCVVGVGYTKKIDLKNIGNVDGEIEIRNPHQFLQIEAPKNSRGGIVVRSGESIPVTLTYRPLESLNTKEGIKIALPENDFVSIPFKATAGVCSWKIDNRLSLVNMSINDIQNGRITVINDGELDIPLEVQMSQPISPNISFITKGWRADKSLIVAGQEITIDLTVTPKKPELFDGSVLLMTNLGRGTITETIPYKFRAYAEAVALDDDDDASVGRIMVGQTASVKRTLTNFGNSEVRYRVRIEVYTPEHALKGSLDSVTEGGGVPKRLAKKEGILEPDKTIDIEAIFESLDEDGDDWHEARLVVEKCEGSVWEELSSLKLVGAGGKPKLVLDTQAVDFGHVGIGAEKTAVVLLQNEGTAILDYEFVPFWDFDPDQDIDYSSTIEIQTQVDKQTVAMTGRGAVYRIYEAGLPNYIDMGTIYLGETSESFIKVMNDCEFEINVAAAVFLSDPNEHPDAEIATQFRTFPELFDYPANPQDPGNNQRLSLSTRLSLWISWTFGETPMDSGSIVSIYVFNPNRFPVQYEATITSSEYSLYHRSALVGSRQFKELTLELCAIGSDLDDEVPSSILCEGVLELHTNIPAIATIELPVRGLLIDIITALDFSEAKAIQFGPVLLGNISSNSFSFQNPLRRPLNWKFFVEDAYRDIFLVSRDYPFVQVCSESSLIFQGPIFILPMPSFGIEDVPIVPILNSIFGDYIEGTGVVAEIKLEINKLPFGVVGIGNPEFRVVNIINPTPVTILLSFQLTNADFYMESYDRVPLPPEQPTEIKLYFDPKVTGPAEGAVHIFHFDEAQGRKTKQLGTLLLTGSGGVFGMQSVGDEPGKPTAAIVINYPKIPESARAKKHFEVENCGETVIHVGIVDNSGNELARDTEIRCENFSVLISPSVALIKPKSKHRFAVTVRGIRVGEATCHLQLRTKTLAKPKTIPIEITATIVNAFAMMIDSIKAFSRADNSIETTLNVMLQEEGKYDSEIELWKILLPVIRISPFAPSDMLRSIPCAQPNVTDVDIQPYTVRPPAIPRELPPRQKKWYMNRVSMALDQGNKDRQSSPSDLERRQEALRFTQPIEKKVHLTFDKRLRLE
ncbi:uncharacterized protein BJ171DRAFT_584296 [Polychytrium aggregatum]|uniref:uncharacterized protein n=1 Tax=Polychytrium aggregatum TaxID=110093 RepID=UPI0022FE6060|nr:uncharacterized protein BJ171DRAFT_584296 [Polychytrium aggregatum]KAI9202395.1 hypothetical protein BJ171DRAFT_584296 [Polychytrium aggregatum]